MQLTYVEAVLVRCVLQTEHNEMPLEYVFFVGAGEEVVLNLAALLDLLLYVRAEYFILFI